MSRTAKPRNRKETTAMAKFQLQAGETLIGKGPMSLYQKQGLTQKPFQGKIYVTDQRVCFHMDLSGTVLMDLPISEVKGFTVGSILFISKVTIHSKAGENYVLTGLKKKKLQRWLTQLGLPKL